MAKWEKQEIETTEAPQNTGPYSQGLKVGNLIFTSGEGPLDPKTGEFQDGTVEEQTILTFKNIEAILRAAVETLDDVVKVTVHLQDINDFDRFSSTYETIFPGPVRPVRITTGSDLCLGKVEAEVIAVVPE